MSKASEWEKYLEGFKENNRPEFHLPDDDDDEEPYAQIDDYGYLEFCRARHTLNREGALALANWIQETFGES